MDIMTLFIKEYKLQNKHAIRHLIGIKPTPIIFEIGSADGNDTIQFINAFDNVDFKLYCFEPDERNIKIFKERIHDPRITLFEGVIGDKTGEVAFYTSTIGKNGDELIYSSSIRRPGPAIFTLWKDIFESEEKNFKPTTVKSVTIDDFVEQMNIPYISYVYADVQGCEDLMIIGGKNTFEKKVRYLFTEYNNNEVYIGEPNLQKILSLLPNYEVIIDFKSDVLLINKEIQ